MGSADEAAPGWAFDLTRSMGSFNGPGDVPRGAWEDPTIHVASVLDHPWFRVVAASQAAALRAAWEVFADAQLTPVLAPVLTGEISSPMGLGSDSSAVEIDFLGKRTFLADSLQFGLELFARLHDGGAWYAMPSFRGESLDERHLNQFFHVEAELHGGLADAMALAEHLVATVVRKVAEVLPPRERDALQERWAIIGGGIPRMEYAAAIERLRATEDGVGRLEDGSRCFEVVTAAGERALSDALGGAVWLTHPPRELVPFYQADDGSVALAADLILGPWEAVGAGERRVTGDDVRGGMAVAGVDPSAYPAYLCMKDSRPLRTAGFGMGLERVLAWCLGHHDVRDLSLFPLVSGA